MQEIKYLENMLTRIRATEEQKRKDEAGITVPERTNVTQPPSRTGEHYSAIGKVRWSLKSQLAELQAKRFVFGADAERRDISIAITHIEDALYRLERVIDNRSTPACWGPRIRRSV